MEFTPYRSVSHLCSYPTSTGAFRSNVLPTLFGEANKTIFGMEFEGRMAWEPIFAVAISLTVATTMVALRAWARVSVRRRLGESDWAAVITLVGLTIMT